MAVMDKVRSLHDAIAADVQDDMSVAMGCALESLIPFAASYEIIRQRKRNLTLIGPISDMQFDQLIGAGCVKKIIASWVGNVAAGLGHNYRRAAEAGIPQSIEIEEHSNFTIGLGLQAAASGLPFLPTRTVKGSDFRSGSQFASVHCPFTNEELIGRPRDSTRRGYSSCATSRQGGQCPRVGKFRSYAGGCLRCEEGHSYL